MIPSRGQWIGCLRIMARYIIILCLFMSSCITYKSDLEILWSEKCQCMVIDDEQQAVLLLAGCRRVVPLIQYSLVKDLTEILEKHQAAHLSFENIQTTYACFITDYPGIMPSKEKT